MITEYTIYDADGKILRFGACNKDVLPNKVQPGEFFVEQRGYNSGYFISNGAVTPLPERPSTAHAFNYTTKQWEPDAALAATQVQTQRLKLLQESDWAALPDVPMTPEERVLWAAYRQGLRDVPAQVGYPLNVVWPVKP